MSDKFLKHLFYAFSAKSVCSEIARMQYSFALRFNQKHIGIIRGMIDRKRRYKNISDLQTSASCEYSNIIKTFSIEIVGSFIQYSQNLFGILTHIKRNSRQNRIH